MIETLQEIDTLRLNFSADGKLILNLTIAFIMFGVALEINPKDFIQLLKRPRPVLVGIVSQFLFMPLLTFGLALSIQSFITPTVGLGMILVAACPGGNISNFISALSRGNIALSVSLTAFSSLAGLILTPFNFAFWGNLYLTQMTSAQSTDLVRNLHIDPIEVLLTIALILGLPLVLGLLFNQRLPKLTAKAIIPIKRLSIAAFVGIILVIFSKNFDLFLTYIPYIFLIVLVHNALALGMGYGFAHVARLDTPSKRTVSIETGIQNSGLALALLFNPAIFPEDLAVGGMAFIAAWWGIWHIIAGLSLAGLWTGFSLKPAQAQS